MIPALLFRVGSGVDLDIRLNRLVVRFLAKILFKVTLGQPKYSWKISMNPFLTKLSKYARGPQKEHQKDSRVLNSASNGPTGHVTSLDSTPDVNQRPTHDLRMISSTMRAQGVTNLLLQSCKRTDEQQMVQEALFALSCFLFPCIHEDIYDPDNMRKICNLTRMKQDCFLSGLSIICDSINNPDISDANLNQILECNTIEILIGGLKMSGWTFNMKDNVFLAFANLSRDPNFYDKLVRIPLAMSILIYELNLHKKSDRPSRRKRIVEDIEDDGTDLLMIKLKPDWACTKIQSVVRARKGAMNICIHLRKIMCDSIIFATILREIFFLNPIFMFLMYIPALLTIGYQIVQRRRLEFLNEEESKRKKQKEMEAQKPTKRRGR